MIRAAAAVLLIVLASARAVIPQYLEIGFRHVLPEGLDHILFLLGLFFLTRDFPVLLLQMTLFTIAHSLTLGLSLYGMVAVPTSWVEVAIALSISFVALENLLAKDRLRFWRPFVVFGCGLVHGLGFAHSFEGFPVATEDFLPALFSFNLGIELAQIAVVGLAFGAVGLWWRRDRAFYETRVARPACLLIAASGFYLALARL